MEFFHSAFQFLKAFNDGFDNHQSFPVARNLTLPAIDGLDVADEIDASGEALGNQRLADPRSLFRIGCRHENDQLVAHNAQSGRWRVILSTRAICAEDFRFAQFDVALTIIGSQHKMLHPLSQQVILFNKRKVAAVFHHDEFGVRQ